ncbi:hypothetical protein B0H14DRAFT_2585284 [Mycena olivaceomarginata]|nr:hypothetical protein B0H14DRAFT_2585284 [Mycena olivaceomarginata]
MLELAVKKLGKFNPIAAWDPRILALPERRYSPALLMQPLIASVPSRRRARPKSRGAQLASDQTCVMPNCVNVAGRAARRPYKLYFPMSSDVDDTFSFLERPGTRAEANLLWTHDLGASQYSRGSLSDCAMDRLALRAEMLIGANDTFSHPNSSSSANDMRSVIQVVDRILLSHARHSPPPIRKSPPSLAPVSLQRGTWHQDRRRVTSSGRRIALGWKRRL